MEVATDMFGTPLAPGQYVAYAATHMQTGMEILKIINCDDPRRIKALCVERSNNWCPNERAAYYKRIPDQAIILKDYKEK